MFGGARFCGTWHWPGIVIVVDRVFHEDPAVLHYGMKNQGQKLIRGMTFTIEPMINGGLYGCKMMPDRWTVRTVDGLPSAQFEHTLAILENGVEILTALPGDPIAIRAIELGGKVLRFG